MRVRVLAAMAFLLAPPAFAEPPPAASPPPAAATDWTLTIEPAFMRPPLSEPIAGSQTAVICAVRPGEGGDLEYATTRGAFVRARERAAREGKAWLDALETQWERDKAGVITRAVLRGDHPLTPAVVLTPAFRATFEPVFGPRFLVVIPDRFTVVLYPRLAGEISPADAAELTAQTFVAAYPVSTEVFTVTRDGLRAMGRLQP